MERAGAQARLGLDIIFREMARGDAFLLEVAQVAVLSSVIDLDTIQYRQDILDDCSRNEFDREGGFINLRLKQLNEKEGSTSGFSVARLA